MSDPLNRKVDVELASWDEHAPLLTELRMEVFVAEQGVPAELEIDAFDPHCVHVLTRDAEGNAIGTGRLLPDGKIGRMAVRARVRRRGVGRAILAFLLAHARGLNHRRVYLDAQLSALPFYERLGFTTEGEPFMEAGIPHQRMARQLDLPARH